MQLSRGGASLPPPARCPRRARRRATARRRPTGSRWGLAAALPLLTVGGVALAQVDVSAESTTTLFYEPGGPLHMLVAVPSVDVSADVGDHLEVGADYEVDIVSGASVAVVDAPSPSVDAVSSATLVDQRHAVGGRLGLLGDLTRLDVGYTYGRERDYRSHAFTVSGSAELFGRNSTFGLSYSRAFDQVCDVARDRPLEPVQRTRMPSSEGCFEVGQGRIARNLAIHNVQASWTQAWSPVLATQLIGSLQLLHGFQGNPYRAVWLGTTSAQEHHPDNRARYALGAAARLWLEPLDGALRGFLRLYRDTWAVTSVTLETGYEQVFGHGWRARLHARWYTQSGAFFYSDDYARFPRGQYFTGDRELSPMDSWSLGAFVAWDVPPDDRGEVLGLLSALRLALQAEYAKNSFPEFHYDRTPVPNDQMLFGTLQLRATF